MQLTQRGFSEESSDGIRNIDSEQDSGRGNAPNQKATLHSYGSEFRCGVVITASQDREDNLIRVIKALDEGTLFPEAVIIVCDGWHKDWHEFKYMPKNFDTRLLPIGKHQPKQEQPRNVGAQYLKLAYPHVNHVWFLDSDCIPGMQTLEAYKDAWYPEQDRILIGPFDYLPKLETSVGPLWNIENDFRWPIFYKYGPDVVHKNDASIGLACISGNLVWPLDKFFEVGGFWNELHHGRAEDGELGLRAVARGIPMSLVREARAYHIWHKGNNEKTGLPDATPHKLKQNEIDVPKINERHAWIHERGIELVDADGKRFNQICPSCGESVNTNLYWKHKEECDNREMDYEYWLNA